MVFHNAANYGYHFIIKELAKEFQGEYTEKYKIFLSLTPKEVKRIDKSREEITKTIN